MIVGDIIPRNALQTPERTALVCDGRTVTFAGHAERAYRLANALIGLGVGHQERISVIARNGIEYLELFGAGEVAGFIVNPVNARLTAPEIGHILGDAEPAAVFYDPEHEDAVASLRADLPGVRQYVRIGGDGPPPPWSAAYEDVLASGAPDRPDRRPGIADTAYLFYTSGTTGRPKGCMLGQRAQWNTALMIGYDMTLCQADRWQMVMPLFHVGAKYQQLAHHLAGATIHVHRRFDAADAVDTIERERITITHLAPTMLQAILDLPGIAGRDLSSLHTISYGAAPMPVPLLRRALSVFGPVFVERYGATESAAVTALMKHQHVPDGTAQEVARLTSAGQPNLKTGIRTVREDGSDCAPGEPGELLIRNPDLVMQGYWRNPEATRAAFSDGWFRSGDVATIDEENFLTIIDRKTEMIISGGENIYPSEVEEALARHPAVAEAAVIGVPDDKWGETVLAFVVTGDGVEIGADDLIAHCRTLIASYKKPSRIAFLTALPRVASGKIDKPALRAPYWQDRDRKV